MKDLETKILEILTDAAQSNADLRKRLFPLASTYVRELDVALQRLRKAGRIEALASGWRKSGLKPCPYCEGTGWKRVAT